MIIPMLSPQCLVCARVLPARAPPPCLTPIFSEYQHCSPWHAASSLSLSPQVARFGTAGVATRIFGSDSNEFAHGSLFGMPGQVVYGGEGWGWGGRLTDVDGITNRDGALTSPIMWAVSCSALYNRTKARRAGEMLSACCLGFVFVPVRPPPESLVRHPRPHREEKKTPAQPELTERAPPTSPNFTILSYSPRLSPTSTGTTPRTRTPTSAGSAGPGGSRSTTRTPTPATTCALCSIVLCVLCCVVCCDVWCCVLLCRV